MRIAAALLALFLLGACSSAPHAKPAMQSVPPAEKASALAPQLRAWVVTSGTNKMDHSPEVSLIKTAEDVNGALIVRCTHGKTEVYVATNQVVDDGSVRVKFDSEPPRPQDWSEASSHDAVAGAAGIECGITK